MKPEHSVAKVCEATETPACWIAVASAEHVAIGRAHGFMQVGHGKGAPLKRLHAGDRVAYYSPVRVFGGKDACQAFTGVGVVRDERIYQGEMRDAGGNDFKPFRRDIDWLDAHEASIRPLLESLSFTQGKSNCGYAFRFGLIKVADADLALIVQAMQTVPLKAALHAPG